MGVLAPDPLLAVDDGGGGGRKAPPVPGGPIENLGIPGAGGPGGTEPLGGPACDMGGGANLPGD